MIFFFNSSLLHLCIETPAVGNLESMCSLQMNISPPFILLSASFLRRAHPCPWVLLTVTFESNTESTSAVCVRSHTDLRTLQPMVAILLSMTIDHCKIPINSHGAALYWIIHSKGHFCIKHLSSSHAKGIDWFCCIQAFCRYCRIFMI